MTTLRRSRDRGGLALIALLGLGWLACDDTLVDDGYEGTPYLTVSGPVSAEAGSAPDGVTARIAWLWWEDDAFAAVAQPVPLEPGVLTYRLEILHPPTADEFSGATWITGDTPPQPGGLAVLAGLPVLVDDGGDGEEADLAVDAEALLRWLLWSEFDGAAVFPAPAGAGGAVALATTRGHLLIAMAGGGAEAATLGELPGGDTQALCPIAGVLTGLTLYRRSTHECGAWQPLAPAGERSEYQGIPMSAPSP